MAEEEAAPGAGALIVRAGVGLLQGLALYGLYHWRKQIDPIAFGSFSVSAWLAPIVFLGAFGAARLRSVVAWTSAAVAVSAILGGYGAFVRQGDVRYFNDGDEPLVIFFTAAALYILHHLIVPADAERRWRASYLRYFDEGWMDAVRLGLSSLFVGVLWLLLWLGASLFKLIGLTFLQELIQKDWFAYPATTTFFALAIHLTDVRIGLVRGARTLLLTLLSWLLTVMTVISIGFLTALPFTGLSALRAAGSSSGTMLSVCAALIILLNATYQEGERDGQPPLALRWFARAASLALVPLVAVAIYGLAVRIGQHGLTPSRIYFAACLLVGAAYALGYAIAALSKGHWMGRLETTNWLTAQLIVVLLVGLFSPLADPMRISVASQIGRLEAGAIPPAKFDFAFLRFKSGRWGREALAKLATAHGDARSQEIARLAVASRASTNPYMLPALPPAERVAALHAAGPLPAGFAEQTWSNADDPATGCGRNDMTTCATVVADIDGQPGPEVVIVQSFRARVYGLRSGRWAEIGTLSEICRGDVQAADHGQARAIPAAPHNDLELGGRRHSFVAESPCPEQKGSDNVAYSNDVTDVSLVKPVPAPPPAKTAAQSKH